MFNFWHPELVSKRSEFFFDIFFFTPEFTAASAAEAIATACQYNTVETFFENNLDYLTHHIIIKLKRTSDEGVLDAVRVIAKLCPAKAVPQLQHVVNEVRLPFSVKIMLILSLLQILASSTAHIYSSQVESYLRVFLAFVLCATASGSLETPKETSEEITKLSAIQQLKKYIAKKEENQAENEETCDGAETGEDAKPSLPAHVVIAADIVRRCLHYLSTAPDKQKVGWFFFFHRVGRDSTHLACSFSLKKNFSLDT